MATKADARKNRIVDAFLGRLATMSPGEIDLSAVAADAEVSLAELRADFDGRIDILDAFNRRIDLEVLGRHDPAMTGEPARERLFDVIMRRFDALAPHRDAVRGLERAALRDPVFTVAAAPALLRSMSFMLEAAGIGTGGTHGRLRVQALAFAYARMVRAWLDDADPGLARTMVAVDRELGRCERAERMAERLAGFLPSVRRRQGDDGSRVGGEGI